MSGRRLALTTLAMAVSAFTLAALSPGLSALGAAVGRPQQLADAAGPDAVVLAWAGLLAWAVWGWGALGLALTAASALPGALGAVAALLLRGVLPAGARRAAALALGVGLGVGVGAPVLASAAPPGAVGSTAPDWPGAPDPVPADRPAAPRTGDPAPDWPSAAPGQYVVVPGDCLWDIAAARLREQAGRAPTDPETASAVRSWWAANAAVIGPDPDLLRPGQVLRPPAAS
jgi:nucleoid-associated protein YgaU